MFKKVLVPIDGSKGSERALETAIELAQRFECVITLLHVSSLGSTMSLDRYQQTQLLTPDNIARLIKTSREAGFSILEQGKRTVEVHDVPVKTLFKEGHAVQEIVRAVNKRNFDLLVIGAKGMSKIKEMPLGSVSEKVIRNAPCSIMVVKIRPNDRILTKVI